MITVYIWRDDINNNTRAVGHTSMQISGRDYISLWPDGSKKADFKSTVGFKSTKLAYSYDEDRTEIGRSADKIIKIENLNESAVCEAAREFVNKWRYNIAICNCSTAVCIPLLTGYYKTTDFFSYMRLVIPIFGIDTSNQVKGVFSEKNVPAKRLISALLIYFVYHPEKVQLVAERIKAKIG